MNPQVITRYVMDQAPVLAITLDKKGQMVDMNRHAAAYLSPKAKNTGFIEWIVDFYGEFDLSKQIDTNEPVLINLISRDGTPHSFECYFYDAGETVQVLGHLDTEDFSLMQDEIIGLNQKLNNLMRDLQKKNARLKQALDHVKQLQGIIPICMHCHKIRNDQEIWERLEAYLCEHTDAQLSHGICPDCVQKYYPEI